MTKVPKDGGGPEPRTKVKRIAAFWNDLSGWIKAATGVLAVLTLLLTQIGDLKDAVRKVIPWPKDDSTVQAVEAAPEIEVFSPDTMLYALNNSIDGSDQLYWFRFDIKNTTRQRFFLEVSFRMRNAGPATIEGEPAQYTVDPGDNISETVDPIFRFVQTDVDEPLYINWWMKDAKGTIYRQGTRRIMVLSKRFLHWDLRGPTDRLLPKDFLVASLTAWVLASDPALEETASRIRTGLDQSLSIDSAQWLEALYAYLYGPAGHVRVSTTSQPLLSLHGLVTIRPPGEVLVHGRATPLEAVLLLAALARMGPPESSVGFRIYAFDTGRGMGSLFLAWQHDEEWLAVRSSVLSSTTLTENLTDASRELSRHRASQPAIDRALANGGVFVDSLAGIVAVDFHRARDTYRIRGLP